MPRPSLRAAQTGLIDALLGQVENLLARTPLVTRITKGVVKTVAAGAASDGAALATVTWQGADVPMPYLATYTPVVGHVVAIATTGNQPLILARVIGTP
jgi:hypothetical protein